MQDVENEGSRDFVPYICTFSKTVFFPNYLPSVDISNFRVEYSNGRGNITDLDEVSSK